MHSLRLAISALMAVVLLGCTSNPTVNTGARIITQYAVMRYAENFDAIERRQRMQNVVAVTSEIRDGLNDPNAVVSIPLLQDIVAEELAKYDLSPADKFLAMQIVQIPVQELTQRIGTGALDPDQKLQVQQFLEWIIQAAEMTR